MKTVKFYKNGNTVRVMDYDDEQVVDKLAPAVYTVCQDLSGFFLTFISSKFEVPSKIYGKTNARVEKIFKTYDDRTRSTGVLMTGDKGSGKTMLSSLLCNKMTERGLPVILVERAFTGTGFINLLNNIGECALLFDEFGKVFSNNNDEESKDDNDVQNGLLSVFDGVHTIKRLILLTENETHKINNYMINRPGRIFYHFKYSKLEESLVREYCLASNIPEDIINSILLRIESSLEFSFDGLKAVVEEYLRFKEDINEIFSNLNIEEPRPYDQKAKVVRIFNIKTGEEYKPVYTEVTAPNSRNNTSVEYYTKQKRKKSAGSISLDEEYEKIKRVYLDVKDVVERNSTRTIYEDKAEEIAVVLEKIIEPEYPTYGRYLDI